MSHPTETLEENGGYQVVIHPSAKSFHPFAVEAIAAGNRVALKDSSIFREAHLSHRDKSKERILETARIALENFQEGRRKKALILGAGNCLDIPLEVLATRFDEVTLVDINGEITEKAVQAIDTSLQRKIKIIVTDVTGVMGRYSQLLFAAQNEKFPDRFETLINNALGTDLRGKSPDLGSDYAFVSSQLVMSQLGNFPDEFFDNIAGNRQDRRYLPGASGIMGLYPGSLDFINRLQQEHIRYLHHSVDPKGTVHLADTYKIILRPPSETILFSATNFGKLPEPVSSPLILPQIVDPVIEEHFTSLAPQASWVWRRVPKQESYRIVAHSLAPKK